MGKIFGRFSWLRGLPIIGLLLPVGIYFFVWVPRQQTSYAKRNFRSLSVLSDQLKARIENAPKALKNLAAMGEFFGTSNTAGVWGGEGETNAMARLDKQIRSSLTLYPTLTLSKLIVTNKIVGTASTNPNNPAPGSNSVAAAQSIPHSNSNTAVSLGVESDVNTSWLTFNYAGSAGNNKQILVTIEAKSDLNNLIGPQPDFDGLVIAQVDGMVIYQRSGAGWKVLRLDTLVDRKSAKLATNLQNGLSFLADVTLGKTDYKLFAQPLTISSGSGFMTTSQWWICGLVESDRFRQTSWAISHIFLVGFSFLVLFCLASLPFLKVELMGSRERLTKGDVFSLVLASLFGCALTSLALLHLYTNIRTGEELDTQLKTFSTNIQVNLRTELAGMYEQLMTLRHQGADPRQEKHYLDNEHWLYWTNILAQSEVVRGFPSNTYPFFLQAIWLDREGTTLKKWTVKSVCSAFLTLKERIYFQDAIGQRHSLYEFNLIPDRKTKTDSEMKTNFWLEPILSWSTGEGSAVLSTVDTQKQQVVALETKLLSLVNPVVPFGFGYCVVAQDGQVLFHSDARRSLRENLLTECDDNPKLRYALAGGLEVSDILDLNYRGKQHNFCVRPLEGSHWSLVVFRNQHIPDSVIFDIFLVSFFLFCFYVLVLGLWWLIYRVTRREGFRWLWPTCGQHRQALALSALNTFLGLAFLLAIAHAQEPWQVIVLGVAGGLLGLIIFCIHQTRAGTSAPADLSRDYGPHVGFLASLLFLSAVLPACAFFKTAHDTQMELFVRNGQLHLFREFQERAARVENESRLLGLPENLRTNFLERRLAFTNTLEVLDIYDSCYFNTTNSPPEPILETNRNSGAFFKDLIRDLRPTHYRAGSESYGLFLDGAVDSLLEWHRDTNSTARLELHNTGLVDRVPAHISSDIPLLNFRDLVFNPTQRPMARFLIWLGLLLIPGVLYYSAQFITRRVLLLCPLLEPAPGSTACWPPQTPSGNVLVLRSSRVENVSLKIGENAGLNVDFLTNGEPALPPIGESKGAIRVDHLEHRGNEPSFNETKRKYLEKLVLDNRSDLIVISTIEPSNLPLPEPASAQAADTRTAGGPAEAQRAAAEQLLRQRIWSDIFQSFFRIYLESDARFQPFGPSPQCTNASVSSSGDAPAATAEEAEPYYWSIWAICSKHERVALYQIATHGFINPGVPELPRLFQRGLVVRRPHLALMNERFEKFVRRAFRPEELIAGDLAEEQSVWNKSKGPAKTALLVLALMLFFTQQELFNSVVGIIAAFTGALPKLLDFFNLFQKNAPGK